MNDLFGSPLSIGESFQRYLTIAPVQLPDGSVVENPNITAARQATQQSAQPVKNNTVLYVMIGAAVILAGVLVFLIMRKK